MRKRCYVFLILIFCMFLFYFKDAYARKNSIVEFLEEKGATKAYISKIVNSSGDKNVNIEKIKESFQEALSGRKSHAFEVVKQGASADIAIEINVIEYYWTEKDPVDLVFSPVAAAVDGAKDENYVRMAADIIVKDAKSGRELWSGKVRSTLTDDRMAKEKSYGLIAEELAKDFVARLCKKPKK